MIKVEILLDSIGANDYAPRLTTWLMTFPRFVLAEFNTHRAFSRNCPSSRAIPVNKRIQMVHDNPCPIIEWGLDKPGMQAETIADLETTSNAICIWNKAAEDACRAAERLVELGIHKQIANRLLEPFVEVTDLMTSTQRGLENFFALRAEKSADPHMQKLAYDALKTYNNSEPKVLKPSEWHIPFGDQMPEDLTFEQKIKVAVARAARVSYNNFDGTKNSLENDIKLHDRLADSGHWSAFEHIAQVRKYSGDTRNGNLEYGWIQLRKTYSNECRKDPRVRHGASIANYPEFKLATHAHRGESN